MTSDARVVSAHLKRVCPLMKRAVTQIGAFRLETQSKRQPYESLIRAVAHQQLHGKAAQTILGRFEALYPGAKFPTPEQVRKTHPNKLRGVGFSEAKARSILDIAQKTLEGVVPTRNAIARLDDEQIVERLTEVRGVGRWTVEMLLIFQLGRPDVLPVDDFGVRHGFAVLKRSKEFPTPKELRAYGERWAPHRTAAAWYLWRVADASRTERTK